MSFRIFISNRESELWDPSLTLRPLRGSDNKRVSGFGYSLRPNPRLSARTSDALNPLGVIGLQRADDKKIIGGCKL